MNRVRVYFGSKNAAFTTVLAYILRKRRYRRTHGLTHKAEFTRPSFRAGGPKHYLQFVSRVAKGLRIA